MAPLSLLSSSAPQTLNNVPRVVYPAAFVEARAPVIPDNAIKMQVRDAEPEAQPNAAAEPDRLSAYLASLSILHHRSPSKDSLTIPLSPRDIGILGRTQISARGDAQPPARAIPAVDPTHINNKAILALFGLLFSSLVIAACWFFFWAQNGGFVFKEGDWEDYKSTVLRRKGPNGTTLSGATKTTELGGGSVVGSFEGGVEEDARSETTRDNDVRHYRHEKPAEVGGINREPDGSYYDTTNTDRSDTATTVGPSISVVAANAAAAPPAKRRSFWLRGGGGKDVPTPTGGIRQVRQVSNSYSFTEGDDATTTVSGTEYTDNEPVHRPAGPRHSHGHRSQGRRSHDRHRVNHPDTISEASYMTGDDEGDLETVMSSDLGTKIYKHSIPGLSSQASGSGGGTEVSVPRGGARSGFRRGGGRRRDSLSDSEGETVR